jgi:D-alanyl-D-alanine carboxypeptidase/D-alanyl-D-alanine-endopeptidase (penicillin-binding protein 4)
MMRDMLRYSTNLTAEVVGLAAARSGGGAAADLAASAGAMSDWARARYGLSRAALVNHSGLTARSALTAAETVRLLVAAQDEGLPGMLRERGLRDADGDAASVPGVRVVAKTGTLNFVSALAGYVEGPGDRRLAFAIFAADPAARARIAPHERDDPPGAAAWARRARAQEQALLRRWIAMPAA